MVNVRTRATRGSNIYPSLQAPNQEMRKHLASYAFVLWMHLQRIKGPFLQVTTSNHPGSHTTSRKTRMRITRMYEIFVQTPKEEKVKCKVMHTAERTSTPRFAAIILYLSRLVLRLGLIDWDRGVSNHHDAGAVTDQCILISADLLLASDGLVELPQDLVSGIQGNVSSRHRTTSDIYWVSL